MRFFKVLHLSVKHCYVFWGVFDALYILVYCAYVASHNELPYAYDFYGVQTSSLGIELPVVYFLFGLVLNSGFRSWLFNVSLIFSCFLFFMRRRAVRHVVNFQTILLLVFSFEFATLSFDGILPLQRAIFVAFAMLPLALSIARARTVSYIASQYKK